MTGGEAAPEQLPPWLTDHGAACEEIGVLGWLLARVVRLADDEGYDEDMLREELRRIAGQARDRASVQRRGAEW